MEPSKKSAKKAHKLHKQKTGSMMMVLQRREAELISRSPLHPYLLLEHSHRKKSFPSSIEQEEN